MKRMLLVVTAVFMLGFVSAILPVQAHEGEDHSHDSETAAQAETSNDTQEPESYGYVAQPGDSYHVLARKAVQTYGIENNVNLSGAQIIYAETNLAQAASLPVLSEGQAVEIAQTDVKAAIESAQALSEEDEATWDYYVQFVDFDTSNNGE